MNPTEKSKSGQRTETVPGGAGMNRGGWGAMGRPVEKAKDFGGTLKRLLTYFFTGTDTCHRRCGRCDPRDYILIS